MCVASFEAHVAFAFFEFILNASAMNDGSGLIAVSAAAHRETSYLSQSQSCPGARSLLSSCVARGDVLLVGFCLEGFNSIKSVLLHGCLAVLPGEAIVGYRCLCSPGLACAADHANREKRRKRNDCPFHS